MIENILTLKNQLRTKKEEIQEIQKLLEFKISEFKRVEEKVVLELEKVKHPDETEANENFEAFMQFNKREKEFAKYKENGVVIGGRFTRDAEKIEEYVKEFKPALIKLHISFNKMNCFDLPSLEEFEEIFFASPTLEQFEIASVLKKQHPDLYDNAVYWRGRMVQYSTSEKLAMRDAADVVRQDDSLSVAEVREEVSKIILDKYTRDQYLGEFDLAVKKTSLEYNAPHEGAQFCRHCQKKLTRRSMSKWRYANGKRKTIITYHEPCEKCVKKDDPEYLEKRKKPCSECQLYFWEGRCEHCQMNKCPREECIYCGRFISKRKMGHHVKNYCTVYNEQLKQYKPNHSNRINCVACKKELSVGSLHNHHYFSRDCLRDIKERCERCNMVYIKLVGHACEGRSDKHYCDVCDKVVKGVHEHKKGAARRIALYREDKFAVKFKKHVTVTERKLFTGGAARSTFRRSVKSLRLGKFNKVQGNVVTAHVVCDCGKELHKGSMFRHEKICKCKGATNVEKKRRRCKEFASHRFNQIKGVEKPFFIVIDCSTNITNNTINNIKRCEEKEGDSVLSTVSVSASTQPGSALLGCQAPSKSLPLLGRKRIGPFSVNTTTQGLGL
jgi:hypothetical protein